MATKMTRMISQEQEFAEEHHDEIGRFLRARKLDESYYHVVVLAYLSAVKEYHQNAALREKVPFRAVAWRRMKFAVLDEYRAQSRQHRHIANSLDAAWTPSLEEALGRMDADMEMMVLLDDLRTRLDPEQMTIVAQKLLGLSNKEIAGLMCVTCKELEKRMVGIYGAVRDTCCA